MYHVRCTKRGCDQVAPAVNHQHFPRPVQYDPVKKQSGHIQVNPWCTSKMLMRGMVADTLHLAMRGCEYLEPKAASFGSRMEPPGTFAHLPLDRQPQQPAIAGAHKHSTVLWRCKEQTKLSLESESDGTSMSSQCTGPIPTRNEIIDHHLYVSGGFVYCSLCWQPHTIPNIHPKSLGYGEVHPVPLMYIQT